MKTCIQTGVGLHQVSALSSSLLTDATREESPWSIITIYMLLADESFVCGESREQVVASLEEGDLSTGEKGYGNQLEQDRT